MKLLKNLACGARLAFFRPVSLACFQISATQTVALIAVDFALSIAIDVMRSGWLPEFSIWGLYYYAFSLLLFLFSAWLVSLGIRRGTAFAEYSVVALSALPFPTLVGLTLEAVSRWTLHQAEQLYYYAWYALLLWAAIIIVRAVAVAGATRWLHTIAFGTIAIAVSMLPLLWLPQQEILQQAYRAPPQPQIDVEKTFYAQPALLADAFQRLAPQRPGVIDLYFIGFAGYAAQDVFLKESN